MKYLKVPKSKRETATSEILATIFDTNIFISKISDYQEEEGSLPWTLNIDIINDDQSTSLLDLEEKLENIFDSLTSKRKKMPRK